MSWSRITWEDSPSTDTPLSAANLNRLEGGIDDLYPPLVTRKLSHSNGGIGALASTVSGAAASFRWVVKLPEDTNWWSIKFRNYDTFNAATKAALTGKKVIFGDHLISTSGAAAETGQFAGGVAATIVDTDFAIPGNKDYSTAFQVTDPDLQIKGGREHLLALGWQAGSSIAMQTGTGKAWYWNDATSGVTPATTGGTVQYIPIDWVLEYETTSRRRAFLVHGDSITEGTTGDASFLSATNVPTSLWKAYPNQWALRSNALVQNHALYNTRAVWQASATNESWLRMNTADSDCHWDGAVIAMGSNDIAVSTSFANVQSYMSSVLANVRTIIGPSKPIYVANILPRNFTGTTSGGMEYIRRQFNSWLASRPSGIEAILDFDIQSHMTTYTGGFSITATPGIFDEALTNDGAHPSYQGAGMLASVLRAEIPTR